MPVQQFCLDSLPEIHFFGTTTDFWVHQMLRHISSSEFCLILKEMKVLELC